MFKNHLYPQREKIVHLLIVLFFSLLGISALFHPGLFTAHDIWHQVARLYYFDQAFSNGQIPPYWVSNLANGYGYPLFIFSYSLPWIIGEVLIKLGLSIEVTIKTLFILSYILSGLFMYIFISEAFKTARGALLASILYLWAPYRFLIILVGASMGIAFVFIFIPVLLLGIQKIFNKQTSGIAVVAIGLSGIILSHAMHLIFVSPVIISFILWKLLQIKNQKSQSVRKFLISTAGGLILGLAISSFYLFPAFYYNNQTKVHIETGFSQLYKRNFVDIKQVIYSKWGYAPIINNAKEGAISLQLGIAQWFIIISLLILFTTGKIEKDLKLPSVIFITSFIIVLFGMLEIAEMVWGAVVKIIQLDYPFRLLINLVFLSSVISAIIIKSLGKKTGLIAVALFMMSALYANRNHIRVNLYTHIPVSNYVAGEVTSNTFNEYLPILADSRLLSEEYKIPADVSIENVKQNTKLLSFDLNSQKAVFLSAKQFFFPGQTLYIDNNKSPYLVDERGRIKFTTTAGKHTVKIVYEETNLMKLSKILTLLAIIASIYLVIQTSSQELISKKHLTK